jgi:hypothetical protein
LRVGTKSVLFGAHAFWLHPGLVVLAWWKLYGFPRDIRLWVAFFVHDLGYWGKPNMDGTEGEKHPEFGARIMHILFDKRMYRVFSDDPEYMITQGWEFLETVEESNRGMLHRYTRKQTYWHDFCLYHSRFYARRDDKPISKLCIADKLSFCLEPAWLYLPRVIASGEIKEYMAISGRVEGSKHEHEPTTQEEKDLLDSRSPREWHRGLVSYVLRWVDEACRNNGVDTWTPKR